VINNIDSVLLISRSR